jgi:NAD(P)-dependent dehydrogenase (short-subunit alcohol dehydrogenase family)
MGTLDGQKVVVTAGGSGIGLGIAECCLTAGAEVFICDVSGPAVEKAVGENPGLRGAVADVGDPVSVESFFAGLFNDWDSVDLLVNNAGIAGPIKPVEFVSLRTLVDPEDMGNMVVFLASDAGKRVTGQLIGVDGNTEWER